MKILITGGNGFLAQHLYNFFKDKHAVYALPKDKLNCLNKNAVDAFFDNHRIDIVIHTALVGREELFSKDPMLLHAGLTMWNNLFNNRHKFRKLIQYGSAYELDLNKSNTDTTIVDVLNAFPDTSYGQYKNIMARMCNTTDKFYNLRIFGNFHYTEKSERFFKKIKSSKNVFEIDNKFFDYFNLEDILTVTDFVIDEKPETRDINLVYTEKFSLTDLAEIFCHVNKLKINIVEKSIQNDLTGDSRILDSFSLPLKGIIDGFKKY